MRQFCGILLSVRTQYFRRTGILKNRNKSRLLSRLLKCLRSFCERQCRPRSDCSYRSSVEPQISHFANFTPYEELVPILHFWKMWNLRMVNFDNFWGLTSVFKFHIFLIFNCEELVRIRAICGWLVPFFSDVKNCYSTFTNVKNWYQFFTPVKTWYSIFTNVKNQYQMLTDVKNWYQFFIDVKNRYQIFTDVKNWYLIFTDVNDQISNI